MDWLLLEKLQLPCPGENPAGINLEYENIYLEMVRQSEPQPEIQYGSTVIAAKFPDWSQLLELSLRVLERSRDLRAGVLLVECLTRLEHWKGLAVGLELIASWVECFWDNLYPELDAEDNNDPTARLGCLTHLVEDDLLLRCICDIPIVSHRTLGSLSLRDYLQIYYPSSANFATSLSPIEVEVIFHEADGVRLAENREMVIRCLNAIRRLNERLVNRIGSSRWSGLRLLETVSRVDQIYRTHITAQATAPSAATDEVSNPSQSATCVPESRAEPVAIVDSRLTPKICNEAQMTSSISAIQSRAEATIAIDYICAYFEVNEPASPVPLLLKRAKRLIPMSFVEILRELAPNEGQQLLQHLISAERLER